MNDRLFNKEVKMEYAETQILDKGTRTTVLYEFLKFSEMEEELNKDVYAFNDIEVSNLLKRMRRSNVISIRKTLSILNDYVKWCIDNGKRKEFENHINYVDVFITTEKNLNKYVSNRQLYNKILNREEFEDLLNIPINPSDQALLLCLYELIGGEELHELRSIEMKNINKETNIIKLTDKDGNIRESKISNKLISLLEDTDSPEIQAYIPNNGEPNTRGLIVERPFAASNYVFKPVKKGKNDYEMISYQATLSRLKMIKNFSDYSHITANSLRETRIIHEVLDLTTERELYEPTDEIFIEVAEKIKEEYQVELSRMQIYSIKQKMKQIVSIKEF